jgi:hypothetical protein
MLTIDWLALLAVRVALPLVSVGAVVPPDVV